MVIDFLKQINEILSAAIVIVAASMLLYNLTHGPRDRVARASSVLLGCVTVIYIGDVFVAISKSIGSIEAWLRIEWIGIAFAPAALFHLSDALLATTGLVSRGRRRRVVRLLYLHGSVFLFTAAFTDLIVHTLAVYPVPLMRPGPLFWLYCVYFVLATAFAFNNVLRARRRCLTRDTHRRMTYLLFSLVTPVLGVFPYSLLFPEPSTASPLWLWIFINLGNLAIILMLAFMAYPLAFFGPKKPDRVIKAQLLSFMLRGPVTGVAVLTTISVVPRLSVIGLPGQEFMPFVAVLVVMALQWSYTVLIPFLERILIYTKDQEQARQIQVLGERLLTPADARQLLEATLAAVCDYLRVPSAFAASISAEGVKVEQSVGSLLPTGDELNAAELANLLNGLDNGYGKPSNGVRPHNDADSEHLKIVPWQSFWLIALRSERKNASNGNGRLIGVMGVWARSPGPDLQPDEENVLRVLYARVGEVLDNMRFQQEVFAKLEDILEEATTTGVADNPAPWGNAAQVAKMATSRIEQIGQVDFVEVVREALRDYWGGPRLTDNRLLNLTIVEQALAENENNPAKAVRAVLNKAIERLKPEGQRSMTLPEWTLYNILDLRFVQGKKVREVVRPLLMSDADLYRKQKIAIERVAQEIIEMERRAQIEKSDSRLTVTQSPLGQPG